MYVYIGGERINGEIVTYTKVNEVVKPLLTADIDNNSVILNMSVENMYLIPDYSYVFIIAAYDKNDKLISVCTSDKKVINTDTITQDVFLHKYATDELNACSKIKICMWDGMLSITPLCESVILYRQ